MDLALITAKQVFELFILILCGVVIGKIKMVNEEGKGMLSNLLIYFVVPFMIINSYMSGYNAEILKNMGRMLFYSILTICIGMALSIGITFLMKKEVCERICYCIQYSFMDCRNCVCFREYEFQGTFKEDCYMPTNYIGCGRSCHIPCKNSGCGCFKGYI